MAKKQKKAGEIREVKAKKDTKEILNVKLPETSGKIISVNIEEEVKSSYIDYAMSVIVGRALPDVRDGFKPVQRRILYAMNDMGLHHNKPYRKSAKVVGEVLGNYHPHGDISVYDSMVRMAQDFSYRYQLLDGQGNFGSVDGDPPAAMRYTEIRLASISEEMLADIDKNTVNFIPNYDQSREEPVVLPAKIPNLLINGCSGIAVGMATNIPPHNLSEVIDGITMVVDNPDATVEEIMNVIKGPDFPTGGYILGKDGIKEAYLTGRGSITLQAKTRIEQVKKEKERIVIYEIPYQVNKSQLIETMANLVRDKKIEGISDIRDESDKEGTRIVVEVKRDDNAQIILNSLFKYTSLNTSFGVIMLALVDSQPQVLNLKGILTQFIEYRKIVVIRRTKYELDKAERRLHVLEGFKIALKELNRIVKTIRDSKDTEDARNALVKNFKLSVIQAQAILDMRLHQLTNLERNKLEEEYKELIKLIAKLKELLADPKKVLALIKEELSEIKKKFGDERRTEIIGKVEEINIEDLIKEEDVVVTLSHSGYIKRLPVSSYKAQKRGGKGITGMETREEDFVEDLYITTTKDYILFFTNKGRVYWLKVYEIPEAGRYSKGKSIVNLISIDKEETVRSVISVREFKDNMFLIMTTKRGMVKKTKLSEYSNPRAGGIIALKLKEGDELMDVKICSKEKDIILATKNGYAIRFDEKEAREIGRSGIGVKGIRLGKDDFLIGMEVVEEKSSLLTVTENGYGKRTKLDAYRKQGRGGKGVINIKASERNGFVVGIKEVTDDDEIMIITTLGIVIRTKVSDVRMTGRSTSGVRLIKVEKQDKVTAVAKLAAKDEEE